MSYWNVLVGVHKHRFSIALQLLQKLGVVYTSDFDNVLLMRVNNIPRFLGTLGILASQDAYLSRLLSLVVPVTSTFSFQSLEEFRTKEKAMVLRWLPTLAGKNLNVSVRCRGFEERISSQVEKHFLSQIILEELEKIDSFGQITPENPDATIAVEIVNSQAGLSCWTREEMQRYPMLKLNC